jgi:adenosylcobinamide kinase/adenosylcobinamide-phosphate guanylyltransferase
MKTFYHGGQKSGKSYLAEQKALSLAGSTKPYYLATYDNSYHDVEMGERIALHQAQRDETFVTIEETLHLSHQIQEGHTYLIDCMSMWLLNTMEWTMEEVLEEVDVLCAKDANIIFVLNDVGSGVIPLDAMSRKYVDRSGIVGQRLARHCDEVYEVKLGLEVKLK